MPVAPDVSSVCASLGWSKVSGGRYQVADSRGYSPWEVDQYQLAALHAIPSGRIPLVLAKGSDDIFASIAGVSAAIRWSLLDQLCFDADVILPYLAMRLTLEDV